jgi:hypothetical protein
MQDLSDRELANLIRDLRVQIAELEPHIDSATDVRRRTMKLIRGTFLATGGFLTATIDILGIVLVVVGLWEWIDVVVEDANAMNDRNALRRRISDLSVQLVAAEMEFRTRPKAVDA